MMERRWHKVVPVLWCASTSEPKTSLWWWHHSFFPHFTLTQSSFLLHQQIAWVSYPQTQKALKHNEFSWTEVWETWKGYFSSNILFLHSSVFPSEGRASDMKFASQSLHIITPDIFSVSKPNMTFFFFCFLVTGLDDMIQGRVLFAFNKNQDNRVLSFGFSHNNKDGNQPFFFLPFSYSAAAAWVFKFHWRFLFESKTNLISQHINCQMFLVKWPRKLTTMQVLRGG